MCKLAESVPDLLIGAVGIAPRATPRQVIRALQEQGLLDERVIERYVARRAVEQLFEQGARRCEAIAAVAKMLCCSYGKIRGIIYQKN